MTKLAERAMLVSLHLSAWSGMLVDREVSDEVTTSHKADKAAGRFNKRIVATSFFADVSTAHQQGSRIHKLYTLPWEDGGTRILANTGFMVYSTAMKDCRLKSEAAVRALKGQLQAIKADGKSRLGTMYNEDDYPSEDDLMAKFGFDVEVKAVPDSSDFRVQMSDESAKAIVKDIERRTNQRLENAMNDVFLRVADVVGHLSQKLKDYVPAKDGNKAGGVIRDSVIQNIYELASEALPILNVTNDPRITALQEQLVNDLAEHSPEILRSDAKVRAATLSKADKILKKVKGYMK